MTTIIIGARQDLTTGEINDFIPADHLVWDDSFWLRGRTKAVVRWMLVSLEV